MASRATAPDRKSLSNTIVSVVGAQLGALGATNKERVNSERVNLVRACTCVRTPNAGGTHYGTPTVIVIST